jgi:hypothetical protein
MFDRLVEGHAHAIKYEINSLADGIYSPGAAFVKTNNLQTFY